MSLMMKSNSSDFPNGHVALFAFPFGSHPMAMLNLTLNLAVAAPTVRFSFFNTAKSNDSLFNHKSKALPRNLTVHDVHDGVPTGHVLSGQPLEAVELFLKTALESFRAAVDSAAEKINIKITCLLGDAFLTFAGDLAKELDVPWVLLWQCCPCSLSAHLYTDLIRDRCANLRDGEDKSLLSLDFVPGLSEVRVKDLPCEVLSEELQDTLFSQAFSQMDQVLPRASEALVLSSYKELSPTALNQDLESKFQKVLNIGVLTLQASAAEDEPERDSGGCLAWLDGRERGSVVYVSFGTVLALPRSETVALAEAVEESNVPFLWSLKDHLKADLPEGFEERTAGRGKIVAWAPQKRVLAHSSVGAFVMQGGWNSIYESIAGGVPMICMPFFADQLINARIVESVWEIGMRIDSRGITKSALVESIDLILEQKQGKLMRERINKLRETIMKAASPDGTAAMDFKTLVGIVSGTYNVASI